MRFFFYGTLIAGSGNPVVKAVLAKLRLLGAATAQGRLYGLPDPEGWYPAMLPGADLVRGALFETDAAFGTADLRQLDRYEDFDPRRRAGSLYVRRKTIVTCKDGATGKAEAYLFNRPLPAAARRIAGGDFPGWLATQGLDVFGGRHGS